MKHNEEPQKYRVMHIGSIYLQGAKNIQRTVSSINGVRKAELHIKE